MCEKKNYRVEWSVDEEADGPVAAAQQVADKYFMPRIAAGNPGTACTFTVDGAPVDLEEYGRGVFSDGYEAYRERAAEKYADYSSNNVEVDDCAAVSVADDGVWVQAWVWVPDSEVPSDN